MAIIKVAKDEALKKTVEREKLAKVSEWINKASENYRLPSEKAKLKSRARLFFEDLVNSAEKNFIELRNGKVAEYEGMPFVSFKRRPGDMFSAEELKELYDVTGCEPTLPLQDTERTRNCSMELNVHLYRTIDGTCNNFEKFNFGSSVEEVKRLAPPIYENGVNSPVGFSQAVCNSADSSTKLVNDNGGGHCYGDDEGCSEDGDDFMYENMFFENPASIDPCKGVHGPFSAPLPSASYVVSQLKIDKKPFDRPFSELLLVWGKFVMNDIVNIPDVSLDLAPPCEECEFSEVCDAVRLVPSDTLTDKDSSSHCLLLRRSVMECRYNHTEKFPPRNQLNDVTAYLDASVVYGSSRERANHLRTFKDGLLKSLRSAHSDEAKDSLPLDKDGQSICGHTRENVFMCGDYCCVDNDPLTYLHSLFLRQHNRLAVKLSQLNPAWSDEILFQESRKIVGAILQKITYRDYLPKILTGDYFDKLIGQYKGYNNSVHAQVSVAFSDIFLLGIYLPNHLNGGLAQEDDVISPLIQHGREHGTPTYVSIRKFVLERFPFLEQPTLRDVENELEELYGSLEHVDLAVGSLMEEHVTTPTHSRAMFGPTFASVISQTFKDIRNGDRFFYQKKGIFTDEQYEQIDSVTMSSLICEDEGDDERMVYTDAFLENYGSTQCMQMPKLDLSYWREAVCYVKIALPIHVQLKPGQVISLSVTETEPSRIRVFTNLKHPVCLPVICPTNEAPLIDFYAFLNVRDSAGCNVTSSFPKASVDDEHTYFNASLSMTDIHLLHATLSSCEALSKQPSIVWDCPENIEFQTSLECEPGDCPSSTDSPDSMTLFPSALLKNPLR